jgi:hypothetical protein
MKNTLIIENIVLYYESCGVKVSKNKVERLSGVGVWPVNPSRYIEPKSMLFRVIYSLTNPIAIFTLFKIYIKIKT